jgi:anthranilate synthase component 1
MSTVGGTQADTRVGAHNLIPVWETFIADCETPVSAFLKLRELAPGEPAFLLESAEQGQRMGRYSFIGFRPRSVLRWSLGDAGDPYALAAAAVAHCRQALRPDGVGGFPFMGGAVGFFGYDLVRTVEPLGEPGGGREGDPLGLPDMALMLTDVVVAFDHLEHTITILANADLDAEPDLERAREAAATTIAEVRVCLAGPVPAVARSGEHTDRQAPKFESNMSRERFEAMVARIVEYVHAGDAFQVVPSQRWSAAVPVEAFSIYRGLRAVNPSPYMYYLDFGDFQVAGRAPSRCSPSRAAASRRGRSRAPARVAPRRRRIARSRVSCWRMRRSAPSM